MGAQLALALAYSLALALAYSKAVGTLCDGAGEVHRRRI
jgi:hypothetical protein